MLFHLSKKLQTLQLERMILVAKKIHMQAEDTRNPLLSNR